MRNECMTFLMASLFITGCGGCDETPSADPPLDMNVNMDMSEDQQTDGTPDLDETPDQSDITPDAECLPVTVCPANTCGSIDDGCGGTLECGAPKTCDDIVDGCGVHDDGCGGQLDCGQCLCSEGVPNNPRCGPCGMGEVTCATNTQGVCSTDKLPILAALGRTCERNLIFVDSQAMLGGIGTPESPRLLLTNALRFAQRGDIIILANNSEHYVSVEIKDGVHIIGGFRREGKIWTLTNQPSRIEPTVSDTKDQIAITALNINATTHLSNLVIRGADAPTNSNSIGLFAQNSDGLVLTNVIIDAGKGGPGADGEDGDSGETGSRGFAGSSGLVGSHNTFTTEVLFASGGKAGTNLQCPGANGGRGAHSVGKRTDGNYYFEQPGDAATTLAFAGKAGNTLVDSILHPTNVTSGPTSGGHGIEGTIGTDGTGGMTRLYWANGLQIEGNGTDGQPGTDGGGGGGGGAQALYTYWNLYQDGDPELLWSWSPSGGGGGAGGCGGEGGQGGRVGGASIGVLLVDSDVTFEDVNITGNIGGDGGQGGIGGPGGERGEGGRGETRVRIYDGIIGGTTVGGTRPGLGRVATSAYYNSPSGAGGNGGYGGEGGNGGQGAGGPSVGIYCVDSKPSRTRFSALASVGGMGASVGPYIDLKDCD